MDNLNRFDGKGEIYAKARPGYAWSLFEYFKNTLGIAAGSVFGDVGSGTGIFTAQLLRCGYKVFAIEPNRDMRSRAEALLSQNSSFVSVDGNDSNMKIPDQSLDCITAAQAFHWFDAEGFRKECRRVLKPGGKVIIVYNTRDESAACTRALEALRSKYSAEFHGFSNGISFEKCRSFFGGKCEIFCDDNTQIYDRQGYINRVLSSSYSLKESDERYSDYLKDINTIFDSFLIDGRISVPTNTVAYIGTV